MMIKKLLFTISVVVSTALSFAQDTTSYRMISCGFGELSFYNNDSTDMASVYPSFGAGHIIFSNPEDSLLYMLIDDVGNSGDRNLFTVNPFLGTYTLVADLNITYPNSGDLGEGNILYLITGNGDGDPGNVIAVNMATFVETPLFTSAVALSNDPTATEYNPLDSSLYIYESFNNNLYVYDLASGTESAALATSLDDEHHGAFYDEINNVFHIGTYGGDMYVSDNTYLNATIYNNSFSNVIDLCLLEYTISADTNYFSGFCPGEDSVKMSLIYATNSVSWYKDGVAITGATNNTYWASETGIYQALIEIGDEDGYMWSEEIELDLFTVPVVTLSSLSDSMLCFNETDITIQGANPGGGSVQWYMNGSVLLGETNQNLVATTAGIYNQIKTNMDGCSDSAAISYEVYEDLTPINVSISQAMNDSLICGAEVIVLDGSVGSVQWYMNGVLLSGETNATYTANSAGHYNQMLTLPSGCADSSANAFVIYIDPACGVGIETELVSLVVFPNPMNEVLYINSNQNVQKIRITDVSGRLIYFNDMVITKSLEINTSLFTPGIYIIEVEVDQNVLTHKLVK